MQIQRLEKSKSISSHHTSTRAANIMYDLPASSGSRSYRKFLLMETRWGEIKYAKQIFREKSFLNARSRGAF